MLQIDAVDEGGTTNFRHCLLEVDGDLHKDDINSLKFLCRDLTSVAKLQKIQEGHDLFHMLEKIGKLSDKNPWLLAELLMRIQRLDLLDTLGVDEDVLDQYVQKHGSHFSPYRLMLLEVAEDLSSEEIDKMVYLLGISKNKREKLESSFDLLSHLEQAKVIGQNSVEKLLEILHQLGRNDLVEVIDKYRANLSRSSSNSYSQPHGAESALSRWYTDKMDMSEFSSGASFDLHGPGTSSSRKGKGVQVEYHPPEPQIGVQNSIGLEPVTSVPQVRPESSPGGLQIQHMFPDTMIFEIARHINPHQFIAFGFQLEMPTASLQLLSQNYPDIKQRSFEMLKSWLYSSTNDNQTTIKKLVLALKNSGLSELSKQVSSVYGIDAEAVTLPVAQTAIQPECPNIPARVRDDVPVVQMERVSIEDAVPYYKMNAKPRGMCVILNNKTFYKEPHDPNSREMPPREGTDIDAVNLQNIFTDLDFIVERRDNQTDTEMVRVLVDIAFNYDHSRYDCFVCCILSHGTQGYIYGSNGCLVNITDLTGPFKSVQCPSLAGKPKLFFFQACQGREKQTGREMEEDSSVGTGLQTDAPKEVIPNEADFLLGYATVPGFVSYRSKTQGSWYITKLVEMLRKYGKREDILSILLLVNNEVGQANAHMEGGRYKQSPAPLYTLRKKVLFQ